MNRLFFFLIIFFSVTQECYAQVGLLDSTFGTDGATTSFLWAWHIAVQTDDKILIAYIPSGFGTTQDNFGISRFKSNGKVDSTFGINGRATGDGGDVDVSHGCDGMALQTDGKILASNDGSFNTSFVIGRYNSNGIIDQSFGNNGVSKIILGTGMYSPSLAIQSDGKIIVGGSGDVNGIKDFVLIRLKTDGTLDHSFGALGRVNTSFSKPLSYMSDIAIQPSDDKIIAVGETQDTAFGIGANYAIARYNPDGSLDSTFGVGGKLEPLSGTLGLTGGFMKVIIQPDNKILLSGDYWISPDANSFAIMMRLNIDGSFDNTFGVWGIILEDFDQLNPSGNEFYDITLQSDSKIIAVGYSHYNFPDEYDFAMARYNSNGMLDSTFAVNGKYSDSLYYVYPSTVALQSTGRIVTANGSVFRFLNDTFLGTLDFSEASNTILIYPNPIQSQATLQYTLTKDEQITIELFDMQGKLVQQFITNETRTTGKHEEVLHLNELLPSGSYILNISNGKNSQGVKVVKSK